MAKYCRYCGNPVREGTSFCKTCGAEATGPAALAANDPVRHADTQDGQITPNIRLCPDGFYRWVYEFSMLKNPTILFTIWKVLGIGFAAAYLISTIATLGQTHLDRLAVILNNTRMFAILALVFAVISVAAYLIVAASYGWKYMVLFEMNENEVRHIQMKEQFEKAQALGWLTAMAAGSLSMKGAGLLAATKDRSVSEFRNVRNVKANRRRHVIYVNQTLNKNQIYAEDADFDFVERFILDRCAKAKAK